jgi:hypothetical protein
MRLKVNKTQTTSAGEPRLVKQQAYGRVCADTTAFTWIQTGSWQMQVLLFGTFYF